jgi:hypothetical protein
MGDHLLPKTGHRFATAMEIWKLLEFQVLAWNDHGRS